jgi:hypothetical protein
MSLSKELVEKFQKIFKEQYGKEMSYEDAYESGSKLVGLFEILMKGQMEENRRNEKLKDNPKGFELENSGGRQCSICRQSPDPLWYDRYGQKCMICQKAVEDGIVPGYVCRNRDSWYSMYDLESNLKLKAATVRKLARNGILNARIVEGRNTHLFLLADNKGILPSKKLLKGTNACISEEDPDRYTSVDWDEYQDPKVVLADYSILEHLTGFDDWKPKYIAKK